MLNFTRLFPTTSYTPSVQTVNEGSATICPRTLLRISLHFFLPLDLYCQEAITSHYTRRHCIHLVVCDVLVIFCLKHFTLRTNSFNRYASYFMSLPPVYPFSIIFHHPPSHFLHFNYTKCLVVPRMQHVVS